MTTPIDSQEIAVIKEEVSPFIINANKIVIKDDRDLEQATETLSQLNIFKDRLIEDREKITAPLNEALKEVRSKYKPTETSVTEAITIVKTKMGSYHTKKLAEQKVDEAKVASGEISLEEASSAVPTSKVSAASGKISFSSVATLKITDSKKIPRKFLIPDEDLILTTLKSGKKVAGCEIEMVQKVTNYRK